MRTGPGSVWRGTRAVRYGITEPLRRVLSRFATRSLLAVALAIGFGAVGATSPGTTGRIEGVVRLVAPDEKPIVSGAYPSRQVNKAVARGAEICNVIVFLRNMPRSSALPAARL